MHVEAELALQKKSNPKAKKKKQLILIVSLLGFFICMAGGIWMLFGTTPEPQQPQQPIIPPKPPYYITNFTFEYGIIPNANNQHVVKITHVGGDTINNLSNDTWISINPPESTPYMRRAPVISIAKYQIFEEGDSLYVYLGKDQSFYASKTIPQYDTFIDFPDGDWRIDIDDGRYMMNIAKYKFTVQDSLTQIVDKHSPYPINQLIMNAQPFSTICVFNDQVYHESVTISKPIRLLGSGLPVLDAGANLPVITIINTSYAEVSGFNIINSGTTDAIFAGILLANTDHNTITNNTIHDNQNGIYILDSNNNIIKYNRIYNNDVSGITLARNGEYNTIKENNIIGNTFGIYLKDSANYNYIVGNTGQDNTRYGMFLENINKNIYEYNNFSYDKLSYNEKSYLSNTSIYYSEDKTNASEWLTGCGPHESPYSPGCLALHNGSVYT